MDLDLAQLRALSAAVTAGTLDAAATALHVTPSAVSQRLRALEVATGRVLLIRSKPVRVTESGEAVLRLARQIELLTQDTAAELAEPSAATRRTVAIAVNADSLGTWVLPALAPLAGEVCFDLHRADEQHTAALLRSGAVVAAITAEPDPVAGCSVTRLGSMRYRPMAAAAFSRSWFPDGATSTALAAAPVVVFDRQDGLQQAYLGPRLPAGVVPPVHYVPTTAEFRAAVGLGMGWGMLPDLQTAGDTGTDLVEVDADGAVDVTLHWQQWKLRSPSLDRTASAVVAAARRQLIQH
ncbi:LysR family transcriptional regulator ArgP [uncultured Cellulomonas sp.]|uniref:LysR family transcriptional regulator ArgP n=1 Tax=uncultured Cellulomonas sp. TaxID=189682 RepID=UPI00260A6763|nr:LysR family transcriptional regulator ArgP [uncultured Cellulomonas sp.]